MHERPWATVVRVPVEHGVVWFKGCERVQAFEPRLTAELFTRWPDRVAEVIGLDEARAWLLSYPFQSLVVTFRFLEEVNGLSPDDPWFARLRDAYLEPWGPGLVDVFDLTMRVGAFAHAFAWARQRDAFPIDERPNFDSTYAVVLRRAVSRTADPT